MLTHTSVHEDFFGGPEASLDLTSQGCSEPSQNGREKKMGAGVQCWPPPGASKSGCVESVFQGGGLGSPDPWLCRDQPRRQGAHCAGVFPATGPESQPAGACYSESALHGRKRLWCLVPKSLFPGPVLDWLSEGLHFPPLGFGMGYSQGSQTSMRDRSYFIA